MWGIGSVLLGTERSGRQRALLDDLHATWTLLAGCRYRIVQTDIMHEGGENNNVSKACVDCGFPGTTKAGLVIVDADYGVNIAEWDKEPWGSGQFMKATEVSLHLQHECFPLL
jgi:hypothetical protein